MKFEWDGNKNDTNIKRHGIDFNDAKKSFNGYTLTIVVVHTETEEKIRIISARKATKNEQKEYFKQIPY